MCQHERDEKDLQIGFDSSSRKKRAVNGNFHKQIFCIRTRVYKQAFAYIPSMIETGAEIELIDLSDLRIAPTTRSREDYSQALAKSGSRITYLRDCLAGNDRLSRVYWGAGALLSTISGLIEMTDPDLPGKSVATAGFLAAASLAGRGIYSYFFERERIEAGLLNEEGTTKVIRDILEYEE